MKQKSVRMKVSKLIKEHKHLIKVLKSSSHKDDLVEAKKQELELEEYKRKAK